MVQKDSFDLLCCSNLALSLYLKELKLRKLVRDDRSIKDRDESQTRDTFGFISAAKSRAASLMSSNGGRAPLLASQWRETMCDRRCCLCLKKQIIYERQLNTSAPNSSSRRFGFTDCFECTAVLGHSCIFSIDFYPWMKPSTFVSTVAVLTDEHLIPVAAQAETQTYWFPTAASDSEWDFFLWCQHRLGERVVGGVWRAGGDSHQPNDSCQRFH